MKTFTISLAALLPVVLASPQITTEVGTPSSTASSSGSVQTVQVGQSGLKFEPDSITANAGDVIEFVIHTTHNVARSSFDSPCKPVSGSQSIWSGDDLEDGTIFSVTVNDTNPVWLYCATGLHCQDGMAMVINPGSDSLDSYLSAAKSVESSGSPDEVAGGVYGTSSGGSASSSASSSATSSASQSSTTTTRAGTSSTTSSAASTTTSPNAAPTMMADLMMIGGAVLGGAVLMM